MRSFRSVALSALSPDCRCICPRSHILAAVNVTNAVFSIAASCSLQYPHLPEVLAASVFRKLNSREPQISLESCTETPFYRRPCLQVGADKLLTLSSIQNVKGGRHLLPIFIPDDGSSKLLRNIYELSDYTASRLRSVCRLLLLLSEPQIREE
jgi:hypothetical protein